MKPEDIHSPADLVEYAETWAHLIYVRNKVDGEWKSIPLNEVPAKVAMTYLAMWLRKGMLPVRLKE